MKSLMSLWIQVAEESATLCCTSASRDIKTVTARVEHEGLSFFTITLPTLGSSTQKWIDLGKAGINSSFSQERGGSLPRFLGGFFNRVFDRSSGMLLDDPCIESILAIRQLTLMFGKMELACSKERQAASLRKFVECERQVRISDSRLTEKDLLEFTTMSDMLFSGLFSKIDRDIYYGRIVPQHGPGSTADRLTGNGKFNQAVWTDRLQAVFPAGEYVIPNWRFNQQLDDLTYLEPDAEVPVKVTLVPKTLKTPRVIAMEPTCMQYMQQAVLRSFLEHLEGDDFLSRVIGIRDQVPNQELALRGSIDQETATLDMSDASDRVSNQLVRAMSHRWPNFSSALDATRSRRAVMPDGRIIRLAKYASMGSALCFPIEAMVFLTMVFVGIQRSLNMTLNQRMVQSFADSVRVYGDDIIVPTRHVLGVVHALELFGAQVGMDKSFWTGKFRESCGREYFNGHDISITRVRQGFPTHRQDVAGVQSIVSLRNQLYMSGYWKTSGWLDVRIREVISHFPDVLPTSPVLGRVSFLGYQAEKIDPYLHSPLVRGYVLEAKPPLDHLEGSGALLKCLLKLDTAASLRGKVPWLQPDTNEENFSSFRPWAPPMVSSDHLERSGRPKSTGMKLRWSSPF
jgi:hypothetical protein